MSVCWQLSSCRPPRHRGNYRVWFTSLRRRGHHGPTNSHSSDQSLLTAHVCDRCLVYHVHTWSVLDGERVICHRADDGLGFSKIVEPWPISRGKCR